MSSPKSTAFLITTVVLTISGLICNGFIVTMMITQWAKYRNLASGEQLFLSLGLSNLCVTIVLGAFHFSFIFESIFSYLSYQICYSFVVFAVIFRFWLTAWLCFFYCIKIVNSTHAFVLWCKTRISWLIPRLLVGSLLISLFAFTVMFGNTYRPPQKNTTANSTSVTQLKLLKESLTSIKMFFSTLGSSCPLLVVLLCSILVVVSLCGHVCQMTDNESHFRNFQTKAHIKAAGTVLSLLLLYVLFYVAQIWFLTLDGGENEEFFLSVVMMMYSPAQAAILLLTNSKIKPAFTCMLQRAKP